MTMIAGPPPSLMASGEEALERWSKQRRAWRPSGVTVESVIIFLIASAAYMALGSWLVLDEHVLVFDGLSRLSHAFFVFWNAPPKLTAIGFVWPPIATLVFLPFAAIKPLATSLLALPLTSAIFGALLLVMVNRVLALARMPRWQRYPLVAAFGANPMIAFYAANGMAEVLYLFFLIGAIYAFMRWYLTRAPGALIAAAVFFSLGILSRYEVFGWAVALTGSIALTSIRQRVTRAELEGTLLTYLAPIAYGVGLWLFFNWLILNDPLFWLKHQAPGGPANGPPGTTGPSLTVAGPHPSAAHVSRELVGLNWHLFLLTLPTLIALVALFALRGDLMALTLAVFLSLNAAFTGLLIYVSHADAYSQLRYNMRAIPLALIGSAWVVTRFAGRVRVAAGAVVLVLLIAAIPQTWHVMRTFPQQYLEQSFTRALATGRDQEGSSSLGGYRVGIAEQRRMADYVTANVHGRNAILTDDAQTFSVMLLTGRPGLFFDRIDKGDRAWLTVRDSPFGKVAYMLASASPNDLISSRYPQAARTALPGLEPVYRVGSLVLLRVARRPPA